MIKDDVLIWKRIFTEDEFILYYLVGPKCYHMYTFTFDRTEKIQGHEGSLEETHRQDMLLSGCFLQMQQCSHGDRICIDSSSI